MHMCPSLTATPSRPTRSYSCMPQRGIDHSELPRELKQQFLGMLPNVNLLYLTARVLILADLSYVSRFWTQFECWLAMCELTSSGLVGSSSNGRFEIVCIHNAPQSVMAPLLIELWSSKDCHETINILKRPDVSVTNAKDKEEQLVKIIGLNNRVLKQRNRSQRSPEEGHGSVPTDSAADGTVVDTAQSPMTSSVLNKGVAKGERKGFSVKFARGAVRV